MRLHFEEEHAFWNFPNLRLPQPILPVTLIGQRGRSINAFALLDTGADVSVFNAEWATRIGLDLQSGRLEHLGGIRGRWR